jgi:pimeloyl-ACP methyl ester carboxylesterase
MPPEEKAFWIDVDDGRIFGIFSRGNENKPLIILAHGWSGNHLGTWNRFFVTAARFFASKGLNVIRFDFRGSGNSTGEFEEQTITSMIEDLAALEDYASEHFDFDGKIVLAGHSQGFYVSLFSVHKMKHVTGLVSWMGRVSDLTDFWAKMRFEEFERKGFLIHDGFVLSEKYIKDSTNYRSAEAISKLDLPSILLIYGEKDDVVPPSEGLKFLRSYKGKDAKLEILEELNHDFEGEAKEKVLNITYEWVRNEFLRG